MSKPDWKGAPEWANYLAMDESGYWHWYQSEPMAEQGEWLFGGDSMIVPIESGFTWYETLEERPND